MGGTIEHIEKTLLVTVRGPIPWGAAIPAAGPPPTAPGVYIVTTNNSKDSLDNNAVTTAGGKPVFDITQLTSWIAAVPGMTLHKKPVMGATAITPYLSTFWLNGECIVYVGRAHKTSSQNGLRDRVRRYFRHRIGKRGSHAGGHWLLTLKHRERLHVWWITTASDAAADKLECDILSLFSKHATSSAALPFANRDGRCISLIGHKGAALSPQTG